MDERVIIRYIETTSKCNYSCPMCVGKNRNHHMSDDDFYSIVTQNQEILKGQRTWLDFCGEPLVDPHIFERIRLMRSIGAIVQLSTNGELLGSDDILKKLVNSGVDYIVVSIPSLYPDIYKKLRGIGNIEQILSNIFKLKEYIDKTNSGVQLQAVAVDVGEGFNEKEYVDFFHKRGIHAAIHQFTNRAHNSMLTIRSKSNVILDRKECQGLKQNIGILSNCDVVTCCCDFLGENSLGNLRDFGYSVSDLIKESKLDKMIEDQKHKVYNAFCRKCDDWIYYQKSSTLEYVKIYPYENPI